jgi:glutathione S-transferase
MKKANKNLRTMID